MVFIIFPIIDVSVFGKTEGDEKKILLFKLFEFNPSIFHDN